MVRQTYVQAFEVAGSLLMPPTPPPAPGENELYVIDARVKAFGSAEVGRRFTEYLVEGVRVRNDLVAWNAAEARIAAGPLTDETITIDAVRPSMEGLIELQGAIEKLVRPELGAEGGARREDQK
jgi:hypothetical protein